LSLLLLAVLIVAVSLLSVVLPPDTPAFSIAFVSTEAIMVVPVAIILAMRHASWKSLGFRKASWDGMALGCGALILVYPLILFHNILLVWLGIETQGDSITTIYQSLGGPIPLLLAGVVLAPLGEEIFFRGFFFQALRGRYGWVKAMLISAAVFAIFHLQLVALIPTFLLGCVLALAYQRSNSIWPGIILHFLVNGLALCLTTFVMEQPWFPGLTGAIFQICSK
jgi:membrane protease YdiL (CAAX protease family)